MGTGKKARRRGHDWERSVSSDLAGVLNNDVNRSYENRDGGSNDVEGAEPFRIQCKAGAGPSPYKALSEAVEASDSEHIPLGAIKFNADSRRDPGNGRKAWRGAIIRWDDLLNILEAVNLDEL